MSLLLIKLHNANFIINVQKCLRVLFIAYQGNFVTKPFINFVNKLFRTYTKIISHHQSNWIIYSFIILLCFV